MQRDVAQPTPFGPLQMALDHRALAPHRLTETGSKQRGDGRGDRSGQSLRRERGQLVAGESEFWSAFWHAPTTGGGGRRYAATTAPTRGACAATPAGPVVRPPVRAH